LPAGRRAGASGNHGDGIEFDENSSGDFVARVEKSNASGNGDAGIRADQAAPGRARSSWFPSI